VTLRLLANLRTKPPETSSTRNATTERTGDRGVPPVSGRALAEALGLAELVAEVLADAEGLAVALGLVVASGLAVGTGLVVASGLAGAVAPAPGMSGLSNAGFV